MSGLSTIDQALGWARVGDLSWEGTFQEDWSQGRTTFGGLVAGVAVRGMEALAGSFSVRSLHCTFAAPCAVGSAQMSVETIRAGRTMRHLQARILQGGEPRAVVNASFGLTRDSSVRVAPPTRPQAVGPDGLIDMPWVPGVIPNCVQHFSLRWTEGSAPFSGASQAVVAGWCRHHEVAEPGSAAALLALMDIWPPPVLPLLTRPMPVASATWAVQFHRALPLEASAEHWWFHQAHSDVSAEGYADLKGSMWAPDGGLLATHMQQVAVFG